MKGIDSMAKIYKDVSQLIGNTPLVELSNIEKKYNLNAKIIAKLEYFNPAGSVKDRVAKAMIEDAENKGLLKVGSTIIEPTSGNTGIGIASVATAKGYKTILTMPETMSVERRNLLKAYGAEIVLTEGNKGMSGAIEKAQQVKAEIDGAIILGQFENMANPQAHFDTTGPEIWNDTDGEIDAFVAGVGTGGTVSGTGRYLKSQNNQIKVIAFEPENSPVLTDGHGGAHKIQGIGAGFVPKALDTEIYDEVVKVPDDFAMQMANEVAKTEGILIGISSGASMWTAIQLAQREEYKGKTIVALLPDTGERYLSTGIYS